MRAVRGADGAAPAASRRSAPGAGADRRRRSRATSASSTTRTAACGARRSFPRTCRFACCCAQHRRTGDAEALRMATLTLEKMAGGRHLRPARRRLSPLLDRRALAGAALREDALRQRAARRRLRRGLPGRPGARDFARVARETLDYVLREMTAPDGGFYSATDADSEGRRVRGGEVLRLVDAGDRERLGPGPTPTRFVRPLRRHRRRQLRGARTSCTSRAPTRTSWAALADARARALRRARPPARRRCATRRSWPPGTA